MLRLSCTAEDLRPLGEAAGLPLSPDGTGPVVRWNPRERARIAAELDAAFLLLYGLDREAAAYVVGTFAKSDAGDGLFASGETGGEVLAAYDRLAAAKSVSP